MDSSVPSTVSTVELLAFQTPVPMAGDAEVGRWEVERELWQRLLDLICGTGEALLLPLCFTESEIQCSTLCESHWII